MQVINITIPLTQFPYQMEWIKKREQIYKIGLK